MRRQALVAAVAGLLLAACAGHAPSADQPRLVLSALPAPPAELRSGMVVSVAAQAQPAVELAWVSGTVKLLGAPVLPMRLDADGRTWRFRTMVPPLVMVPAGDYQIKAWGRTRAGAPIEGQMSYEVR